MSIYATLWEVQVRKSHRFDEEWICVYAQAVPAHIGHPSQYPEGDDYKDFLPPVVEYDPNNWEGDFVERAVVILAERPYGKGSCSRVLYPNTLGAIHVGIESSAAGL